MKKILTTTILCLGLFMIGCQKEVIDSDEQALTPEETELNEIKAFAEEHGLTFEILNTPCEDGIVVTFEELKQIFNAFTSSPCDSTSTEPTYEDHDATLTSYTGNLTMVNSKLELTYKEGWDVIKKIVGVEVMFLVSAENLGKPAPSGPINFRDDEGRNMGGANVHNSSLENGKCGLELNATFTGYVNVKFKGNTIQIGGTFTMQANNIPHSGINVPSPKFTIKYTKNF